MDPRAFLKAQEKRLKGTDPDDAAKRVSSIRARCLPPQLDFITDEANAKSLRCPRRSGKTDCLVSYAADTSLARPRRNVAYISITGTNARRNFWRPFGHLLTDLALNDLVSSCNSQHLQYDFLNGSAMFVMGADNLRQVEKVRGGSFDLLMIDECGAFPPRVLAYLVETVADAALADRDGTLVLAGTPALVPRGLFFDATAYGYKTKEEVKQSRIICRPYSERKKWRGRYSYSFHHWTAKENTAVKPGGKSLWSRFLAIKEKNGWDDESPTWRREYLGEWVNDDSLQVYKFQSGRNNYETLPELPYGARWEYVLGCDLGYMPDPSAFVVLAFSDAIDYIYLVEAHKEAGLIVDDVADRLKGYIDTYNPVAVVGDLGALGKMIGETIRRQHEIPIQAAKKSEKREFIEVFNSAIIRGHFKVPVGSEWEDEASVHSWKDDLRLKESDRTPNHVLDAALYLYRYLVHRGKTSYGKEEAVEETWEERVQRMDLEQAYRNSQQYSKLQQSYESLSHLKELQSELLH